MIFSFIALRRSRRVARRDVRRHRSSRPGLLVLVLCLSAVVSFWTAGPAAARTRVVELTPSAMSYTNLAWPFGNYADEPSLLLSHTQYATYLRYDTPAIAAGEVLASADLVLQVDGSSSDDRGIVARYSGADWSVDSLRYAGRPGATSGVVSGQEDVPPVAGARVVLPLIDTSGIAVDGRVGLQLGFAEGNQDVQLSRSVPPQLRLTVTSRPHRQKPPSPGLPYAVPPIGQSDKKVFAHYLTPYPISLDDEDPEHDYYERNYLAPGGEDGKYRSVGGLLRDRPVPRQPLGEGYELADATREVEQAAAAGIDGFTIDILDWHGTLWDRTLLMAEAAERDDEGFVVVPNLDLSSDADDESVDYIADRLAEFYSSPAAYRLADGRYVLSSFKAEARPASWWTSVMDELEEKHGIKIALISVLLDGSQENMKELAPVSYALSTWGLRTSASILNAPDRAATAHALGVKWMAPVAVQDVRPRTLLYAEAGNTETLRTSWARAMSDGADLVQLVTWNDYSESTQFAPSVAHGSSFLDVNGYFVAQFKGGAPPRITGDELVVTHRIQKYDSEPTSQRTQMSPTLSGVTVKPRDTVEVLAMLKAPAVVTVRVGSSTSTFSAPAGLSTIVVPLKEGLVAASAVRAGRKVATVTSPYEVVDSLPYSDLQYYAASSRKDTLKR